MATRAGAIALTAHGSWKWAPEIEIARAKLLRRSALGAGPETMDMGWMVGLALVIIAFVIIDASAPPASHAIDAT